MNRIFVVPAIVEADAIAVMLWQPMPFGLYAQLVSVAVMAVVFAIVGARRLREVTQRFREIRADQRAQADAFRRFVHENTARPNDR
jgi:membrane protein implicated in regulation of membrane protease activity